MQNQSFNKMTCQLRRLCCTSSTARSLYNAQHGISVVQCTVHVYSDQTKPNRISTQNPFFPAMQLCQFHTLTQTFCALGMLYKGSHHADLPQRSSWHSETIVICQNLPVSSVCITYLYATCARILGRRRTPSVLHQQISVVVF